MTKIKSNQEKTILHIIGGFSKKYGGLEHYFIELAKNCNDRGYLTVLQYESLPNSKEYIEDLKKINCKIVILNIRTTFVYSVVDIFKLIRSIKPEIIQIHWTNKYVFLTIPLISKILGVKKILCIRHGYLGFAKRSIQRFVYNQYDKVIAVSETIANNLILAGVKREKVTVHYLGLFGKREKSTDLRKEFRKEFNIPIQATVIGCIAFDNPVKGLEILLNAFQRISNKKSEIHLIIIGVNPNISLLPKLAEKLGITKNVHWAGIRDNGWQILNAADIYVQPSLSEGLCLAILEAMALKLPIVATRAGGNPEIVKDEENGYLAVPNSIDSLADTLEHMLSNPSKWENMGNAGYNRYQNSFSGKKSIEDLIDRTYLLKK